MQSSIPFYRDRCDSQIETSIVHTIRLNIENTTLNYATWSCKTDAVSHTNENIILQINKYTVHIRIVSGKTCLAQVESCFGNRYRHSLAALRGAHTYITTITAMTIICYIHLTSFEYNTSDWHWHCSGFSTLRVHYNSRAPQFYTLRKALHVYIHTCKWTFNVRLDYVGTHNSYLWHSHNLDTTIYS